MPNLATPLYAVPSLIQPISLVGCHGLNFFVGAVNGGIAQVLSTSSPHRRSQTLRSLFFGISLWVGVSVVQYSLLDAGPGRTATVAAIAPGGLLPSAVLTCKNGTRSHFGEALPCNASLKEQIEWTRRVVVKNNAKMVVWSEAWVGAYENRTQLDAAVNHTFAPLAKELGILLTIGMHTMDRSNLAVTISPTGEVLGYYGKMNPVQLLGERNPTQYGYRDFDIHPDWLGYTKSKVRVGPLICYDMDFPESVATLKRRGVEIVLSPSSDWSAMRNHIAAYVFRAIENRMPIVKADTGWDSAIVDARGNVIASYTSQVSRRHIVVGTVKLGSGDSTVAAVYGNLVPLVCLLFLVSWKFVIVRSDGHVKLA
ncbi:Apolipoprotein N-acyltransferase, putative [Perkinsus marinus ATCC 50983]|uniref:Apolipoprotein N-acyltransferase, putative n=1 Tax=Perkinsus marinus (strain ATCC 50983 / TXsc) TaxID=423536 RepID=C5KAW6_PERM5|nr:Apolipoprotein N-acyltransferase, putative [Perkinsus marinus ATCC 50983]EER18292.1 Apolipoprotein N-acyltransferase, putative [Perkinsus marinus ATCC 50983]|eukprot:XP_002786496.1 Apolipoprotein N-acyltransferase, putative [Perkinsus marinus ATCC 50983]